MPIEERVAILNELLVVDEVITFNDDDDKEQYRKSKRII